jgi:hypothetical protein
VTRSIINIATLSLLMFLGLTLLPTFATAQEADAQVPNTGQDLFRPPKNLFQLTYGYRTAPGSGSTPGSFDTVTTDTLNLRLDHRIDLSQQSLLALRSDLPLLAKNPITSSNPDGDYLYGIGDADVQNV